MKREPQWLATWLDAHNRCDFERLQSILHDDVLILAHIHGRSEPPVRLCGIDEISVWFCRMPEATFTFSVKSSDSMGEFDRELPAGDDRAQVQYTVESDASAVGLGTWRNEGHWFFHLRQQTIVGVRQAPNDIPKDPYAGFSEKPC